MTEAECKEYTANNGLKEHDPFSGSWANDCSKCMQSGDTVAYNTHSSPGCTSSWETVCDEAGAPTTHIPVWHVMYAVGEIAVLPM